jgi:hypothetical protein
MGHVVTPHVTLAHDFITRLGGHPIATILPQPSGVHAENNHKLEGRSSLEEWPNCGQAYCQRLLV